ncbi:unnamed protein product [Rotaria magnacalcarata]|uniref:C2H2-type domain-containing protein n=7 Tax=Rotaria magnacalcarata TaxID=392030 RepID=A0A814DJP5_9BILA|nr:unnamed protein product [Rotaria magnacalcarata]CAF1659627.1 unnamed protein product [Rotaria magnacalcarata]CAF2102176.1 unnamed protein product [Rotaria magnacalcarata]
MSHANEARMQTLHDTNTNHPSGENIDPELYQLKIQLAAIQEQQRLQTLMIKQFQQQLKVYQQKRNHVENEENVETQQKYSCTICNHNFPSRSTLQKHIEQHRDKLHKVISPVAIDDDNNKNNNNNEEEEEEEEETVQEIDEDDDDEEEEDDDRRGGLIIQTEEDDRSATSPLDLSTSDHLSSTSLKSDEEQQISSSSSIQFQMEEHEGEPEDPNMAKLKDMIEKLERTTNKTDSNECVVCKRILSCQSALKMHYRTHTGERPFRCRICARAFSTKGNLKTHMNVHRTTDDSGTTKSKSCSICQKQFNNIEQLRLHLKEHLIDPNNASLAEEALRLIDSERSLSSIDDESQIDVQRDNQSVKREEVEEDDDTKSSAISNSLAAAIAAAASTYSNGNLTNHLSPFNLFNPQFFPNLAASTFPFLAAAAAFNNTNNSNTSINDEHKDNSMSESGEDLSMSSKMLVDDGSINEKNHSRRSSSILQHICNVCSKNFSSASALQIHNRTHTGEKPYKCDVCGRAFTTKGNLKVHTGTHMYHTQKSPTMVNSGVAARQRRRYDFHPYSVNIADVGKSITSSPSSTIIKSES